MIDMNSLMPMFKGFMNNPMQFFLSKKMNLPPDALNNPQQTIQNLLNSGQMSQAQFNKFAQMAKQMQDDPNFSKFFR